MMIIVTLDTCPLCDFTHKCMPCSRFWRAALCCLSVYYSIFFCMYIYTCTFPITYYVYTSTNDVHVHTCTLCLSTGRYYDTYMNIPHVYIATVCCFARACPSVGVVGCHPMHSVHVQAPSFAWHTKYGTLNL